MAKLADARDLKTIFDRCTAVQESASDSKHSELKISCIALHDLAPTKKPTILRPFPF
jgi:hypothetical protein